VPTLSYRRIDDLEQDPLFLAYIQHPLFEQIARRYVGDQVSVFRSMFMNKPAHWEQTLPWHQDVGEGWGIDTNPIATVWTALDDATKANGAMEIVPGSHRHGIINERHFLSEEEAARYAGTDVVESVETEAGEAVLLHNLLLHRSGTNPTSHRRRAFSVTYMTADTRARDTGMTFPVVFGQGALDPATVDGKAPELIQKFYG
jgi:ectoine hydroxylase-related dioxygenase (phytanoyl-CoA dioxygenase family)